MMARLSRSPKRDVVSVSAAAIPILGKTANLLLSYLSIAGSGGAAGPAKLTGGAVVDSADDCKVADGMGARGATVTLDAFDGVI